MLVDRLKLYVTALDGVPTVALKAGAARAMRTRSWFPKPAELRQDVEAELEAAREGELRQAVETTRQLTHGPFTVFGRMSKAAVQQRYGSFMATEVCTCVGCLSSARLGPPRFVPDGVYPDPICPQCTDTGLLSGHRPGTRRRCVCHGTNPNLLEATRVHTIEMGRWLHGDELAQHEQAQAAFMTAMRRVGVRELGDDAR